MPITPIGEYTPMGTKVRKEWIPGFYREVLRVEKHVARAICGGETKDLTPCRMKPFDKYGGYCHVHKEDPITGQQGHNPTATTGATIVEISDQDLKIMSREQLYSTFPRCDLCSLRSHCHLNTPGHYCKIMEDNFFSFIDSVRHDYDLTNIDLFTLYNAAQRWASQIYATAVKNNWSPTDDESIIMQIASVRESKEFRSCMKDLGLTRAERMKARREAAQISMEATQMKQEIDLSQYMAKIAEKSVGELAELAKRNNPSQK